MVKHHIKTKKKRNKKELEKQKQLEREKELNDLGRFAGSSEEENEDGVDGDDSGEEEEEMIIMKGDDETEDDDDEQENYEMRSSRHGESIGKGIPSKGGDEEDGSVSKEDDDHHLADDESSASSDEDEYHGGQRIIQSNHGNDVENDDDENEEEMRMTNRPKGGQMKMAFAMSRILGLASPTESQKQQPTPILSKTTTPLQKLQKKEQKRAQDLKLKRQQRRITNLIALHKPLSVATSAFRPKADDDGDDTAPGNALGKEIEVESMHRRVATRGVVALFNTIAKHQQQQQQQQNEYELTHKNKDDGNSKMTKFGFMDMLKQTAVEKNGKNGSTNSNSKGDTNGKERSDGKSSKSSPSGWNALKDDFLMNSKLNDWDKELSDDEEDVDDGDDVSLGDDDEVSGKSRKRSQADDLDDVMDDDDSSDDEVENAGKRRKKISSW